MIGFRRLALAALIPAAALSLGLPEVLAQTPSPATSSPAPAASASPSPAPLATPS
ncbi:AraC family transcriptional regulator, partial [Bradyrhizobium sp. WBOS1]|nr:AraC family transcriptional regulator [Bradyrhizobium sp. WBOS1]